MEGTTVVDSAAWAAMVAMAADTEAAATAGGLVVAAVGLAVPTAVMVAERERSRSNSMRRTVRFPSSSILSRRRLPSCCCRPCL